MPETIGRRLAQELDRSGLRTLDEQAAAIGIPSRTLQDILADKVERPQRRTMAKIDAWLGTRAEGETAEEWPEDLVAFLEMIGAYLFAMPEKERLAAQARTFTRIARRDY